MDHMIIGWLIAFLITFSAIPIIIRVAEAKKLFDVPDDRKIHLSPVPSLGGLGIFAGFILATLIASPGGSEELQYFIAAGLVIFFLGLKDDILVLSPLKKFLGQLLAAFIIVYKGGIQINSMYGFFGIENMPQFFSLAITYFTVVVITNSFNLIDGVDGLAGSLGFLTTSIFGLYFYFAGYPMYSVLSFAMAGSIAGFLIFNYSPARIFMGDTGSLLIGLVNAILAIKFINVASSPVSRFPIESAPAIGFAILLIPLFDTLRVFAFRILTRRSPFSPDRNHIHHILLDKGFSHRMVTFIIVAANILFISLTYMGRSLGSTWLIIGLVSTGFSIISLLIYTNRRERKFYPAGLHGQQKTMSSTKVIPIAKDAPGEKEEAM